MGQELMTPAQIADICDGRDKAIALWLGLYDTYHATRDEAARLTLGGPLSLSCGRDWTEDTLTRAFIQSQPIDQRDKETGARQTIDARDNFERVLTHTMDRRCWAALMEQLGTSRGHFCQRLWLGTFIRSDHNKSLLINSQIQSNHDLPCPDLP